MSQKPHAEAVQTLFDAKANSWSAKYQSTPSKRGAPLAWRLDAFRRAVAERCPPPARLLDFGCGTGDLAQVFAERGYQVTACDVSERMLARARASFGEGIRWIALDAGSPRLPFADAELDVVVASSVLEYVADVGAVFGEWARILRPSGVLVATVPDTRHPLRRLEKAAARALLPASALVTGRAGDWLAQMLPRAAHYVDYLRLSKNRYSHDGWIAEAERHGFVPFSVRCAAAKRPLALLAFDRR